MPKVPAQVLGVPLIAIAVAVPSLVAFIITQQNGVDSIDNLSHRLANSTMFSVTSQIQKKIQDEPEAEIRDVKENIELGARTLNRSQDAYWIRRSHHWMKATEIFTMAATIITVEDPTPYAGSGGVLVDAAALSVILYEPFRMSSVRLYENSTVKSATGRWWGLNLNARPYALAAFEDDEDLLANEPRWTVPEVTISGSNSGLFTAITIPIFLPNQEPSRASFFAVSSLLLYLNRVDLKPYLLSAGSTILIMDWNKTLVLSTDHEEPFYRTNNITLRRGEYAPYYLWNCEVPKLEATDPVLGDVERFENGDEFFGKVSSGGETHWVSMTAVFHYNRRWYVVMWTPEKTFFAEIDEANRKTMITVIVLIVACTLLAAVVVFVATLPLKTLARAFDKVANMDLDHADIHAVKPKHFVAELDSLHKGFGHAVKMVEQVKAFLPDVAGSSDEEESLAHGSSLNPSSQSTTMSRSGMRGDATSVSRHSKKGKAELMEAFSLGIKIARSATLLVIDVEHFASVCSKDVAKALQIHSDMFQVVTECTKTYRGVIGGLEGNRFLVAWNTSKPCQVATSKSNSVLMVFDLMSAINQPVSFGLHHSTTFYGILGSKHQRFNVVGSEIVEFSAHLASHASRMQLSPPVLISGKMIEYLKSFCFYVIDTAFAVNGATEKAYWVEKKFTAESDEWMYELAAEAGQKQSFLDPFFGLLDTRQFEEAETCLDEFVAGHAMFQKHADYLRAKLRESRLTPKAPFVEN
ncbi:hypothetical protein DIPPA_07567 [Diplonema papillatum]|nr:hypothetical protein DIPPA_07567 [Diplonema papillatum]